MNQTEITGIIDDLSRIEQELHDAGEHEWAAQIGGNRDDLKALVDKGEGTE